MGYEGLMTRVVRNPNLCLANSIRQRTVQYGEAKLPEPPGIYMNIQYLYLVLRYPVSCMSMIHPQSTEDGNVDGAAAKRTEQTTRI